MDNLAREVLKTKLKSFKGTAFQDALDRIYLIIYDNDEFIRIKQKRDKGSDGILNNNTILAAYAPESYKLSDFKKKTSGDYNSYLKNWSETHKSWLVITNLESTSEMVKHVKSLNEGSYIICIERLLTQINHQTWTKKSSIFKAFDIQERYLTNDVLATAVDDLIKISEGGNNFLPYEKPLYITSKITLNVQKDNVDIFMDEYEDSLKYFPELTHVLQLHTSASISSLRSKVRNTYKNHAGSFEEKFELMLNNFLGDQIGDDYYKFHMRVVLIYFFEQCLFGLKTREEIDI